MRARLAGSVVIVALMVTILSAATFVRQTYRFLALTGGRDQYVFWIVEDLSGEANSSYVLQVVLDEGNPPILAKSLLRDYGDWQWLVEGMGHLWCERFILLPEEQGTFSGMLGTATSWIKPPEPNESSVDAFRQHVRDGGSNALSWNEATGIRGVDLPIVEGAQLELVYYYPRGLYIDYTITEVYHFRRAAYLLLFTHQEMLATGMDTMHGFMILKISGDGG